MKKILLHILKENNRFSQGRVYLFVSILAYYITMMALLITGIRDKSSKIDLDNFKIIIDGLQYVITVFAGYVLGGKFIFAVKSIRENDKDKDNKVEYLKS